MENNKIKRTTNRAQFEKMVRLMKEQPDIAKNLSKTSPEVVLEFWQKLQDELNALGPPIKEITEWKKVWSDYKSSLRKKLAHNKRELKGTGGGRNTQVVFTPLDEEVIQLVCLRAGVDGVMTANKFGVPHKRTFRDSNSHNSLPTDHILPTVEEFILSPSSLIEKDFEMEVLNEGNEAQPVPQVPQTKGPKQIKLLEKQIEIQQNLYKTIEKFNEKHNQISAELNVIQKRIARAVEKLGDRQKNTNDILQAQLDESKHHNKKIEQLALEKNKMKEKILQIELKKLELDTKL